MKPKGKKIKKINWNMNGLQKNTKKPIHVIRARRKEEGKREISAEMMTRLL